MIIHDGWREPGRPSAWILGVALVAAFFVLHRETGFPAMREPFSGTPTAATILVMFACVILGTLANYFYYKRGPFSWMSLIRPVTVSPLVILPLLGTLEGRTTVDNVQLIWFGLLAFQNGFFWRVVFDRAKPRTK
jgi:hypothetical protein